MGLLFALIALASWGIGDFLIQRSARRFGDLVSLFYITAFASVALFPFVFQDLHAVFVGHVGLPILLFASVVILAASLLDFEALRVGKISVVEPVYALEVAISTALAAFVISERLSLLEYALIGSITVGILLVSTQSRRVFRVRLERGVLFALFATVCMGLANFLFGIGARTTGPLMVNWFTSAFLALVTAGVLLKQRRFGQVATDFWKSKRLIVGMVALDNLAWVAFSASMLFIPIGVATGISESYIALAALLGLVFNRERLKPHQWVGLALCLVSVVALSVASDH